MLQPGGQGTADEQASGIARDPVVEQRLGGLGEQAHAVLPGETGWQLGASEGIVCGHSLVTGGFGTL